MLTLVFLLYRQKSSCKDGITDPPSELKSVEALGRNNGRTNADVICPAQSG